MELLYRQSFKERLLLHTLNGKINALTLYALMGSYFWFDTIIFIYRGVTGHQFLLGFSFSEYRFSL